MNSIIEAQQELKEQLSIELERCKDCVYFAENYLLINGERPNKQFIDDLLRFQILEQAKKLNHGRRRT